MALGFAKASDNPDNGLFYFQLSEIPPLPSFEARKNSVVFTTEFFGIRRRPTLPGRYQPSTIGTEGLNFCVRYGNRCDPFVITTGNGSVSLRTLTTAQLQYSGNSDLLVFLLP